MKCPKCHANNSDTSRFCGECGTQMISVKPAQPAVTKTLESPTRVVAPGTVFAGRYEILDSIGAGGMGEVYRALDKNLDRQVAIKVLPAAFAEDKERMARFEREAKLLATLNHPNIAAIHGLEESEGRRFFVLELVEGETLQARLDRGALPIEEALETCRELAEGLEAAHEKGVVHRDLKPGNIMISPEGKVKILDFGLAKAYAPETSSVDIANSPTITAQMTKPGIILGTAAYMSPEQAKGRAADKRADIWAFGCILFECLTGKRAFAGETTSEIIASILKGEPEWKDLPTSTQTSISALIRRCLQKDKNRRQHDISDARLEIEDALANLDKMAQDGARVARKLSWLQAGLLVIGAVVATALAVTFIPLKQRATLVGPTTRLEMSVKPARRLGGSSVTERRVGNWRPSRTSIAVSPDGKIVVFEGVDENGSRLYRRFLEKEGAEPIADTAGGRDPILSADGRQIAFWANGKLMKVTLGGGIATPICDCGTCYGASWGPDDKIIFSDGVNLRQVPSAGGSPEILTQPNSENGEICHLLPHVLPGGKAVLFCIRTRQNWWYDPIIAVLSLETKKWETVIDDGADARYSPTGHIVFARQGKLLAAPFSLDRLKVTGEAIAVLPDVMQAINATNSNIRTFAAQFNFSNSGTLAYARGGGYPDFNGFTVVVDKNGTIRALGKTENVFRFPRVSPLQKKAVFITYGKNQAVWVYDMIAGFSQPLVNANNYDTMIWPLWTPDGNRITYCRFDSTKSAIYWTNADGTGTPELLVEDGQPGSWSPDGKSLAYVRAGSGTSSDIWILSLESKKAEPVLNSQSYEAYPEFSPDGRYIAYASDITGRTEVYVTPWPGSPRPVRVSDQGGHSPVWSPDMKQLYYLEISQSPRAKMIAADITTNPSFSVVNRRTLFDDWGLAMNASPIRGYDLLPDGQGFICNGFLYGGKKINYSDIPQDILDGLTTQDERKLACFERWLREDKDRVFSPELERMLQGLTVTKIDIVQNWFEELKRLVPTGKT